VGGLFFLVPRLEFPSIGLSPTTGLNERKGDIPPTIEAAAFLRFDFSEFHCKSHRLLSD